MPRVRSRVQTRRRHKKVMLYTKGHRGKRRTNFKVAHQSMMHALRYSTDHRRERRRDFRRLWIVRINAAARANGPLEPMYSMSWPVPPLPAARGAKPV